jgi:hypothetical protein
MYMLRHLLVVGLSLGTPLCHATHARGGEIRYEYLGIVGEGYRYTIEIHLYSDPGAPADRPELILHIGNEVDTVPRGDSIPLGGCPTTIHCIYPITHIFPGPGAYLLTVEDPNRTAGLANIPNSVNVPLGLRAVLEINSFGANSSARFNAPVTDQAYTWSTLVHDPLVTDPDGDSLSFELVTCLGGDLDNDGIIDAVPDYALPEAVTPPGDFIWVDPGSGVLLWDQPNLLGYYQIALKCTERRLVAGTWITVGEVTRDMTLCVSQIPTGMVNAVATVTPLLTPIGGHGMYMTAIRFTDLRILDAAGRMVVQLGPGHNGTIDLSRLSSGTYTVVANVAFGPVRSARLALVR